MSKRHELLRRGWPARVLLLSYGGIWVMTV
ncbi:hypothetical protein [Bradyrhizobium liaoningense]